MKVILSICVLQLIQWSNSAIAEQLKPNLILTAKHVQSMAEELSEYPVFNDVFLATQSKIEALINDPLEVPVPEHGGGGYTHEQHKKNYLAMYEASTLYQITKDSRYAKFVRDMLSAYAELYPRLGLHPVERSSSRGRLFWQTLNESVWLLHSIQAFDAIADTLSSDERALIVNGVLLPMATFLSDGQPKTFDKIHNHATWAAAAVGMVGYALERKDLVDKALYGLDKSGNSGFMRQLELLFSPDGYYNEGPYYHRYALMPFVLFAQAIENNQPALKVFEYRNKILLKAIYGLVQLSYNGLFFPINDAIKDKGVKTIELQHGIAIAYGITGDPALLSVARDQGSVVLTGEGLALARGLSQRLDQPFPYRSLQFSDGAEGGRGGLSILRSGSQPGHQALVMKNTAQGLGHGHFDKLALLFYDNGKEVVPDYGAARFLNIEPKNGGHYLPENHSWAKQTIAHNTLVVDEESHFNMDLGLAEIRSPEPLLFQIEDNIEIVSARMDGAYEDVSFIRTVAMIKNEVLEHPVVLDVFAVYSDREHQYDLPLHYKGQLVNIDFDYRASEASLSPLGTGNGYQHLWRRASADLDAGENDRIAQVSWLLGDRFYTFSTLVQGPQQLLFAELGANDPGFNLTPSSALIRRKDAKNHTFVSILEPHGEYNGTLEFTRDPYSSLSDMDFIESDGLDLIYMKFDDGVERALALSYDADEQVLHRITYQGMNFEWRGYYHFFEI